MTGTLFIVVLVLGGASAQFGTLCTTNSECSSGFFCIEGECLKSCGTSDAACNIYNGERCINSHCRIGLTSQCASNDDCPTGYLCTSMKIGEATVMRCMKDCSEGGDDDCIVVDGLFCIEGVCQILKDECVDQVDCPKGYTCNNAFKRKGELVKKCLKDCVRDSDCNAVQGFVCNKHQQCSHIKGLCEKDSQCGIGYVCQMTGYDKHGKCVKDCKVGGSNACDREYDIRCVDKICVKMQCAPDSLENCHDDQKCAMVSTNPTTWRCLNMCTEDTDCTVDLGEECKNSVCVEKVDPAASSFPDRIYYGKHH